MTVNVSRPMQGASDTLELNVLGIRKEAEGVVTVELGAGDGRPLPSWEPGAHIDVILRNGLVRQYSLCGDPRRRDTWRLGILLEPAGRGGSSFIHQEVKQGDNLWISGPRNNFKLVDAERYLFIAGGIGITPILPMLRHVASAGKHWRLLYGGRTRKSMAFVNEISQLGGGETHVLPQDEHGLLPLATFLQKPAPSTVVYCCGPGPLIDAVEGLCRSWPSGTLHRERFAPSERKVPSNDGSFEVELARSGRRLTVPSDRSLLEVLEDAGCEITNSCRAGICGTCLVNVVAGAPEHNDDILTDEERESGQLMLPCVSRSKSDLLVLDL